jgi:LCP family protein required for cell wall assembly
METPTPEQPAAQFQPRHTTAQKVVLGVNIALVIGCIVGAVGLLWGKNQLDNRLQTAKVNVATSIPSLAPGGTPTTVQGGESTPPGTFPPADPEAQNFLITGSDANACVTPGSPWANAADQARENIGNRSDTIMVLRVDPTTRQAAVLSFPRDLWVKIPGKAKQRINTAYVRDDYSLLAQTLYENFGITVDHYLQVDFCAFKRIVDAVGGVAVPFDTPILDKYVGISINKPGCHVFSGDEALAYVRSRHLKWVDDSGTAHEDRASDFGRISRQQDFLRRVLQTALKKGLFDPKVAQALIASLQTEIVTEQGFTITDMMRFAGVMRDVNPKAIQQYQVEGKGRTVSGSAVLDPQIKGANMQAILAIFQGKAPLAGAPDQVLDTTTSTTVKGGTTTSTSTTTTVKGATTTDSGSTTTVVGPEQIVKGDILPSADITC